MRLLHQVRHAVRIFYPLQGTLTDKSTTAVGKSNWAKQEKASMESMESKIGSKASERSSTDIRPRTRTSLTCNG